MERVEPYRPRSIRFLELWEHAAWRIKVYGIAYRGERPTSALVEAARDVAAERLPLPAVTGTRYGVGFLGIHEGRGANFVFIDWWADENELHHHVYASSPEHPADLEYVMPDGSVACVWDLRVLAFEREAWVETALRGPGAPDLEAYLERRLNEDA